MRPWVIVLKTKAAEIWLLFFKETINSVANKSFVRILSMPYNKYNRFHWNDLFRGITYTDKNWVTRECLTEWKSVSSNSGWVDCISRHKYFDGNEPSPTHKGLLICRRRIRQSIVLKGDNEKHEFGRYFKTCILLINFTTKKL